MSKRTKIWTLAAIVCIIIGGIIFTGVMTALGWDFKKLSTDKFETNTHTVSEAYKNISIKTIYAQITFVPSDGEETKVACHEYDKVKHTVTVEDGTLTIGSVDSRKWYHHIGIRFEAPKITITLPKGEYGDLQLHNTTGDVKLPRGFTFDSMDLSVTTGDLYLSASATGDAELTGVRCGSLTATGTTGDLEMKDVIATGKLTAKRTTGDVELEACDASEIFIKVTTGDVEGTLLTPKTFRCKATTGRVNVPNPSEGGLCEVKATTGDIKLRIK